MNTIKISDEKVIAWIEKNPHATQDEIMRANKIGCIRAKMLSKRVSRPNQYERKQLRENSSQPLYSAIEESMNGMASLEWLRMEWR